jgi:hypothetical protein
LNHRFQDVRGRMELVTRDALQAAGIPSVTCDNTLENQPALPYAIVSISFGHTIGLSFGCVADNLQGTVIVTLATAKQRGSTRGEDAAQAVLQAWGQLNCEFANPVRLRTYNHDGPVTVDPGQTPRHLHTLNCSFTARVFRAVVQVGGLVDELTAPIVTEAGSRIVVAF